MGHQPKRLLSSSLVHFLVQGEYGTHFELYGFAQDQLEEEGEPIKVVAKISDTRRNAFRWDGGDYQIELANMILEDAVATQCQNTRCPGIGPKFYGLYRLRFISGPECDDGESQDVWVMIVEDAGVSLPQAEIPYPTSKSTTRIRNAWPRPSSSPKAKSSSIDTDQMI